MIDALVSGLIAGAPFALIALGVSLIFGVADVINFAHGSIFGIGALLGWYAVDRLHWPLAAALVGVMAACAALAMAIDAIAVRPLARASRIAALLSTLAVGIILDRCSELVFGSQTRLFTGVIPHGNLHVGPIRIAYLDLTIFGVAAAAVALLGFLLRRTRIGRALRASAADRDAARQMGIDVDAMQSIAFALSGALAGLAGVLVGMAYRNVEPSMAAAATINGFAAAALGGLGSLEGALAGGLILGVAESFGVTFFGGAAQQFVAFIVVIAVFWLRPNGLFARTRTRTAEPLTGTFLGRGALVPQIPRAFVAGVLALAVAGGFVANDYLLRLGSIVAIFAVLGLSLTLVSGTSGIIALGQAGFMAIGAYATALLTKNGGWPYWAALPASGLLAAVVAALVVAPVLRLRGHDVAIATLAVGAAIVAASLNFSALTNGPLGIANIPSASFFGYSLALARGQYVLAVAMALAAALIVERLQRSHLGLAWRALREDETAAASSGIEPAGYKALAYVVGAFIAALAGSLLVQQYGYVSPDMFGLDVSVLALTIVVLGGLGSAFGAIVGAVVLVGAPELFRPFHDYRLIGYGLLLLGLVRFRPAGIFGYR
jgi:branched-chain amino acid transport system permease protein